MDRQVKKFDILTGKALEVLRSQALTGSDTLSNNPPHGQEYMRF